MEIRNFVEIVKMNVEKILGKEYEITIKESGKNNGVIYIGLSIRKIGLSVAPLIYLNEYFEKYNNGCITIEETVEYVIKSSKSKCPIAIGSQFLNYDSARKNIVYRLINTERNKELLEDIPHIEFLDLSIVFRYLITEENFGSVSILIHKTHMEMWNVTTEELFQTAKENTQKLEGYEIQSMTDVICDIMKAGNSTEEIFDKSTKALQEDIPLYVLSNKSKIEGAACMLYPNLFRNFADVIGSSFYIIPSSIHELLLLPVESMGEDKEFINMIKVINDTQVAPEEILSYSLYYYDKEEDKVFICR